MIDTVDIPPLLSLKNITVDYGQFRALDDLSLDMETGQVIGIIGPNGAGKTSLIKALCGRVSLSGGAFYVNGAPLRHGRNRQSIIGLVPQDIALYPHMTARENLLAFTHIMGISGRANRRDKVDAALASVELSHKSATRVSALSGGMKRRINVAAAIMHDPQILILDEPTAGVDIPARDTLHRLAKNIANPTDGTSQKLVLLITHELEQAESICDQLLILGAGKLLAYGPPAQIMASAFPSSREVIVHFFGAPNQAVIDTLAPFKFTRGETPTEWTAMTNASEVSFVSAFMASLRGGGEIVREITVRRPGLTHLMHHIERTGTLPRNDIAIQKLEKTR